MSGKSTSSQAKDTASETGADILPAQDDAQNLLGNSYVVAQAQGQEHGHDHHHHHHAPEPGRTSGSGSDGRNPNSELPAAIQESLKQQVSTNTATRSVVQDIITHGRGMNFKIRWSEGGGYYNGTDIFIDPEEPEEHWFGTMAHEIVHMRNDAIGREGDIRRDSREDYVNKQMEDEIECHAICFGALIEEGKSQDGAAGYNDFLAWIQAARPDLMDCPEEGPSGTEEIIALAKTWLEDKYRNEWTTSNTGVNYYEYWGSAWDEFHRD